MKLTLLLLLLLSAGVGLAATEEQTNRTFKVTPGGTLIVDVDPGSIDVNTNAGNEVVVEVWRKAVARTPAKEAEYFRKNPVAFTQDGNTVTIRCRQKEKKFWFDQGSGNQNDARYTIRVPSEFSAKLDTAGGAITVTDLTGKVKADTSGGNLRFARIRGPLEGETSGGGIRISDCAGEIKIETSGGNIEVTGGSGSLKAGTSGGAIAVRTFGGSASVETSGGDIAIENVKGEIKGSTSGGTVKVLLLSPVPGDAKLSTSGGNVTVQVAENAAFDLDAETSAGKVACDLSAMAEDRHRGDKLKGKVNGGGPTVWLRTSAGDIRLNKL